jgi:hypothetical protein
VTTDGVPRLVDREAGFVTLFTKYIGHTLLGFHCALCAKAGHKELEEVTKIVTKALEIFQVPYRK